MTVTMDTHAKALVALAALGHRPDRLLPEHVVPFSIGVDEASKTYVLGHRSEYFWALARGFLGLPAPSSKRIIDDERTRKRVQAWASS
jgi:hypothetical protein